jgi:asparagine synthase (glutamine-hydrolysing)
MCGIVGELTRAGSVDVETIERRNATILHRGPDEGGVYVDPQRRCALAMRRLSIVDLGDGHQPMANEDRTVWVVFNGEIYNHAELRRELEAHGHRFATHHSDTEVIVHGYEQWGVKLLARLRGMFGLAVWDQSRGTLVLARDRLGKKPLYYSDLGDRLLFGSELRTLLADPAVPTTIDVEAIDQYLTYQFILAPHTVLQSVKRLPAGHCLVAERGQVRIERYWQPPLTRDLHPGPDEALEQLDELLAEAVRLRMEADVPVGTLLSGGIDSSLVTALAQRVTNRSLHTFSVGFREASIDESQVALQVAKELGTVHHPIVVDAIAPDLFAKIVAALDEPLGDPAALPTYLVSELAATEVKVVLTGEGGDEMFAGYDVYGRESELAWLLRLPVGLRRAALSCLAPAERIAPRLARLRAIASADPVGWHDAFVTRIHRAERWDLYASPLRRCLGAVELNGASSLLGTLARDGAAWDSVAGSCLRDIEVRLPEGLLMKVDKMTMAHSIEARTPFLDHRLAEWALRLPSHLRRDRRNGKLLLKRLARRHLPASVVDRRKHPFEVPIAGWLNGSLREPFAESVEQLTTVGFSSTGMGRLTARLHGGDARAAYPCWLLLVLGSWLAQHPRVRLEN